MKPDSKIQVFRVVTETRTRDILDVTERDTDPIHVTFGVRSFV
jgi:hypothetical protein